MMRKNTENVRGGVECINIYEAIKRGARDKIILISNSKSFEIEKQLKEQNFNKVFCVSKWIRERKFFYPVIADKSDFNAVRPFNHYESPYPDMRQIHRKENEIFDIGKQILDIDFNVSRQLEVLKKMEDFELPKWEENKIDNSLYRYYYNNGWFGDGSANALYYMLRIVKPKTIIEVGSGYSTAVMLDTNENYFDNKIKITAIEPRADRLKSLLKATDNIEIIENDLQEVPLTFFETLKENDILFIDSSHVSKINSDVNYIFFEILPRLSKGIYIHFHDIFYPFIYPKELIYGGTAYNEMYILRAFLMNNKNYSIQLFGEMMRCKYADRISEELLGCGSGSLWIKKEEK